MKTPTLSQFKKWAKEHASLANAVCLAQAFAQIERERVDAYVAPIFARYGFQYGEIAKGMHTGLIENPKYLYLCEEEEKVAAYYAECDKAHRQYGFEGKDGECPALVAETLKIDAENALLDAGCKWLEIDRSAMGMDHRKQMLDLLIGGCIKASDRLAA